MGEIQHGPHLPAELIKDHFKSGTNKIIASTLQVILLSNAQYAMNVQWKAMWSSSRISALWLLFAFSEHPFPGGGRLR